MSQKLKIVYLDVSNVEMRGMLADHLPDGFELEFAEADTEQKAAAAAVEADFIITWCAFVTRSTIDAATRLKLIQVGGEGVDFIDLEAAARRGIPVARTPGGNTTSVAELATLLILATLRRLPQAHETMKAGRWLKWELRFDAHELLGKQVGIVGLGKIGRIVAGHVRGFGALPVYYNRLRLPKSEETGLGVRFQALDELLSSSDVVTLHVPLTPATKGLIGRRELALMKPTAILVNTCRGAVVDEQALHEALRERRIRGAGLDVFADEPAGAEFPFRSPFQSLENVVLSPHNGGGTAEAMVRVVKHAYANILKASSGQPLDPDDLAPLPRPNAEAGRSHRGS